MAARSITLRILIVVLAFAAAHPARAATGTIKVAAFAPIERGDVASAQRQALNDALKTAVQRAVGQMIPEKTYAALEGLIEDRVLARGQDFISTYHIVDRDVSDLAYTVHVSARINVDLLREHLAALGIIKEPGSPPLAAVFITVDAPLELGQFQALGSLLEERVAVAFRQRGITVIPAPEGDEMGFRVIRPPQEATVLRDRAAEALADLAVGVMIRQSGQATAAGKRLALPVYTAVQAVEVSSGVLVDLSFGDSVFLLGSDDSPDVEGEGPAKLAELADKAAMVAAEKMVSRAEDKTPRRVQFIGAASAFRTGRVLYELSARLGDETEIIPSRFTSQGAVYTVWTTRKADEFARVLESAVGIDGGMALDRGGETFSIRITAAAGGRTGVREFGEEVTFYRRLPVAGVENPDDVRKIEFVPWHETEDNGAFPLANDAPLGMGILAKIDPSRDLDMFRYLIPKGTAGILVALEHTGPGEVRPRIRAYSGDGRLLAGGLARRRGTGLRMEIPLHEGTREIVLSVEDDLGRYPSMFPYVLTVTGSTPTENEPS